MTPHFHELLGEATRLTRSGQLRAATALIGRALGRAGNGAGPLADRPPPHASDDLVIDAESRVLPDTPEHASPPRDAPRSDSDPYADRSSEQSTQQWLAGNFAHQGRQLDYRLYVPPLPAGATPPMLVMLHGCTQDAADFAAGTRMNELAREAGVLVLYPEQTAHANAQRCWNWFKPQHQARERGEPALLAALTRHLAAEHRVDTTRIYAAGLSAGGAMAAILGSRHPDLFAAVGVHSGLPAGAASDLPSALAAMRGGAPAASLDHGALVCPVIVFHGDADATVHPRNGQALVDAARSALHGTQAGHPQLSTGCTSGGQSFTRTVIPMSTERNAIEYWQLHGAGHAWSGGSLAGSYTTPEGVDASAEMLRFFLAHQRMHCA